MPFMEWDESYATRIKTVDDQHKRLLRLVNDLSDSFSKGVDRETLNAILKELIEYSIRHFTEEEEQLQRCRYPHILQHKQRHDEFTYKVLALQGELESGSRLISRDVLLFLKGWWNAHIMKVDMQYVPYLASRAAREVPRHGAVPDR